MTDSKLSPAMQAIIDQETKKGNKCRIVRTTTVNEDENLIVGDVCALCNKRDADFKRYRGVLICDECGNGGNLDDEIAKKHLREREEFERQIARRADRDMQIVSQYRDLK